MTKAERKAEREADAAALDEITAETIRWAKELGGSARDLGISLDANGEAVASRLGHGFDRDVLEAWEAKVKVAFKA